jgi:hypothetical protein
MPNYTDCIFTLDGVAYNGVDAFMDKLLAKDATITPEQESADTKTAKEYGYDHPAEALNSVNKRTGKDYKYLEDVPKEELQQASKGHKIEKFNEKVDTAASKLIDFLTPKSTRDVIAQGASIASLVNVGADIIKAAYKAGTDIAEAVGKAIDHIKKNWDEAWGEFDEQTVADHLYKAGALSIDEEIERTARYHSAGGFGYMEQHSDAGSQQSRTACFCSDTIFDAEKKSYRRKQALKGMTPKELQQFAKSYQLRKTGRTIDIMGYEDFKKDGR